MQDDTIRRWIREERIYDGIVAGLLSGGATALIVVVVKTRIVAIAAKIIQKHDPELGSILGLMFHSVERGRDYGSFDVWALWNAHIILEGLVVMFACIGLALMVVMHKRRMRGVIMRAAESGRRQE